MNTGQNNRTQQGQQGQFGRDQSQFPRNNRNTSNLRQEVRFTDIAGNGDNDNLPEYGNHNNINQEVLLESSNSGQDVSTVTNEEQPILTTLINAASSRNKLHPGDIRWVISDSVTDSNSSQASIEKSLALRPKGKLAANMLQYNISRNNVSSNHGALVDRGANGGIAGNDVRIITTSTRRVDVSGINSHELTHLPIVTDGRVVSSQRGEIIIILN